METFGVDQIADRKAKAADEVWPKLKAIGMQRSLQGFYSSDFFHKESGVIVSLWPRKVRGSFSRQYDGFIMKIDRGYPRSQIRINIDKIDRIKEAIDAAIARKKSDKASAESSENFRKEFHERLKALFPGKLVNVFKSSGGFTGCVTNTNHCGGSLEFQVYSDWTVGEASIKFTRKTLEQMANELKGML